MLLRTNLSLLFILLLSVANCHAQETVGGVPAPIVPAGAAIKDTSSYAIGFNIGGGLAQDGFSDKDIEGKDFMIGLLDALAKKEPKLTQAQFQDGLKSLQQRLEKKMIEVAKLNLEKANAFLEANKKKEGVQVTKTGLQYQVLKSGTGKSPTFTDTVVCHFEGKLIDGRLFESSIKKNQPAILPIAKLPLGWSEGLQRMKVGDKWTLVMPPNLAFGEQGSPPIVGPNEAIILELELLEIQK
jgi:FKBP-type peptidyl-prolyl cis-trans isomerase FklB